MRRMTAKDHAEINNLLMLFKMEKVRVEQQVFQELGIDSLPALLRYCNVSPREVGSVLSGVLEFSRREEFHMICDVHTERRQLVRTSLEDAKIRKNQLTNHTVLTGLSLNDYDSLRQEVELVDSTVGRLQAELDSIPQRNGITDHVFDTARSENLIAEGFVRTGERPEILLLTEKGEKTIDLVNRSFDQYRGMVRRGDKIEDEFLLSMFAEIKATMMGD